MTVPNRRWFRFSLRTLFVVVTVFVVLVGYHLNWIRQRHELLAEKIRPFTTHRDPRNTVDLTRPFWEASGTARPPGMLWLFREPGVELLRLSRVHDTLQWADRDTCHKMSEPDLTRAKNLFPAAKVTRGTLHPIGPRDPFLPFSPRCSKMHRASSLT